MLNKQHQTVKEQLEQLRMKKSSIKAPQEAEKCRTTNEKPLHSLVLDSAQRKRLQQQMQQVIGAGDVLICARTQQEFRKKGNSFSEFIGKNSL